MSITDEEKKQKAREYQRLYRLNNLERVKATARASYHRNFAKNQEAIRVRSSEWRKKNPDEMQAFRDAWIKKGNNAEKTRRYNAQRQSEYRRMNPEDAKLAIKKWRLKNKDKIKIYASKWRETHRTELTLHQNKRRFKTLNNINKEDICNWESRICGICHEYIEDKFHIDHKIPLAKGGLHVLENLQLAHPVCNLQKKDKLIIQ